MKTSRWLWAIVALQLVAVLAWAGYHEVQRSRAAVIRLKVRPVDPHDLIRGDYLVLAYDVSECARPEGWTPKMREVYVVLAPEGRFHGIAEVRLTPPAAADTRLWVRAAASERPRWQNEAGERLSLRYGIEEFFVPEGRGQGRFEGLEAEVGVSSTHRLYLKRLFLDGKVFP